MKEKKTYNTFLSFARYLMSQTNIHEELKSDMLKKLHEKTYSIKPEIRGIPPGMIFIDEAKETNNGNKTIQKQI